MDFGLCLCLLDFLFGRRLGHWRDGEEEIPVTPFMNVVGRIVTELHETDGTRIRLLPLKVKIDKLIFNFYLT